MEYICCLVPYCDIARLITYFDCLVSKKEKGVFFFVYFFSKFCWIYSNSELVHQEHPKYKITHHHTRRSTTPSNFYNMSKKLASPLSFLPLYNLLSAVGWSYLLYLVISLYPKVGQPAFFYQTKNVATLVQCGAIIEIINSFLGVVRSPLLTTVAQG